MKTNDHSSREEKKSCRRDIGSRERPRGEQRPDRGKIIAKKRQTLRTQENTPLDKRNRVKNELDNLESNENYKQGKTDANENLKRERHETDGEHDSLEDIHASHPRIN